MAKFEIWAEIGMTVKIGEIEADSHEEAETLLDEMELDGMPEGLCHHCADYYDEGEVDISTAYLQEES